ncbi:MAG TPA: glycosyltransferase family 2 protein [Anaeromyxobacteraceae bacterium]|nr:glycosyltransferase family 2 protein [Anaeromyxobacteraceae bacterium]
METGGGGKASMVPAERSVSPDSWIVVVNWNGAELLPRCLAALERQTRSVQVIVVDNGSSDASAEVVARFAQVVWLPLGKNVGFAAATNAGFRRALAADARWVGTVNTDVELSESWLEALVSVGESRPHVGLLCGLLLFADNPTRVNSTGLALDCLYRARDRDFGTPLAELARPDGPVAGVTGGAALFRAEALRRVGLFDPAYFAYCEDVDLSLRAASAGIGAWYVSTARALHGYGRTFGSDSPWRRYLLARNHMRVIASHLPLWSVLALTPALTFLRAWVKAPLELARGRPAHASAHLRAAGAGALAAIQGLSRRLRGPDVIPPGAEPQECEQASSVREH